MALLNESNLEASPEPEKLEDLEVAAPDVSAYSMGNDDNIGDILTADTIENYLSKFNISRTMWMSVLHHSASPHSQDNGLETVKIYWILKKISMK